MRFEEFFVRDGRFVADGVALEEVAGKYPTPFYIYSGTAMRTKYRLLKEHFPAFDICYSLKANPNPSVCGILLRSGAGAEIHAIVADAVSDLELIEAAARGLGMRPRVLLRINTRETQPEAKEVMVGGPSKFGFDEENVVADVAGVRLEQARIAGVQVYSASQVLDKTWLATHIEYVFDLARRLSREMGFTLETVDFGGGFGVPQHDRDPELDLSGLAGAVAGPLAAFRADCPECRLVFESGRYLVAESGVFVTRVIRVKESRGRVFAVCDGGMNAFARPVFMHIRHPARLLNRLGEHATNHVDVCGPICTPLDCIAKDAHLPMPKAGDFVGLLNAGAYGYTMSLLDFMSRERPVDLVADAGALRRA
jgi:diaminopimelate decarboxylase